MQNKKQLKKRTSRQPKPKTSQPKKETSKKKNAGGRPSTYEAIIVPMLKKKTKEGKNQIEDLAFYGLTDEQLANHFGVTRDCVTKWKKEHPEFKQALDTGKLVADRKIIKSLYERAMGYEHPDLFITQFQGEIIEKTITKHYPPDTGACFIWLKNRQNWQNQPEFNLFDEVEINVNIVPRNPSSSDEADT